MQRTLTSQTNPIRVVFLPRELTGGPGRIGLTIAPGKKQRGMAGLSDRDLELDLARLKSQYRADVLVSLLEPAELVLLGIPELIARARAHAIEPVWYPIVDFGVPRSPTSLRELTRRVLDEVDGGRTVVVHCRGGLGRTGLVGASLLVARGVEPACAIEAVRAVRPGAIENALQEQFVYRFRDELTPRDSPER